nr:PREDICTED: uncharacterized protein LOC102353929 isoform X1 [Latimeria chalumnae]|eukprot:XP_014342841.1 PREDICTED: uncharacterized protein LOC102353929 isoform X1 [Latimeria chalumnae]
MFRIFNDNGELNVGGFQIRLRAGMPSKKENIHTPSSLDHHPVVPCCTMLIRLLPHTQDPVPSPDYFTGYYFSEYAKPSNSELEIISTFQKDHEFPNSVGDMATKLMDKEQKRSPDDQWAVWYKDRLDAKKQLPPHHPPAHLNLLWTVRYHQRAGIRVRFRQAFGLKADGLYVNVFARILKGAQSLHLPELPERWGGEEKLLTRRHDFTSLQKSPRWTDPSVVLHPYLDAHTVLLIQIFGLDAVYTPDHSGQQPGTVTSHSGEELEINVHSQLGWSVVPLFDGSYVRSGVQYAPLFQDSPSGEFLQSVISCPVKNIMTEGLRKKTLKLLKTCGSVAVEVWDGHYFDDEHYELSVFNDLLTVGNIKKFLKTQNQKRGREMSQLVLQTLNRRIKKLGRNSAEYQQEERFYEEAMADKFYTLMETALMDAGYGPL